MPDPGLATAADYSEALSVARRAKSLIALLLVLMLVTQLSAFLLIKYNVITIAEQHGATVVNVAAAQTTATQPVEASDRVTDILRYVTGVTLLGGVALGVVMTLVILLIANIMLVGRLIGVGKVTSALVWAFVLVLLLFPWQAFMNIAWLTNGDFRIPGVLWTWDEMVARVHIADAFDGGSWAETVLRWTRFVVGPLVAIFVTLLIQLKSNRGLRMALGEDEILNEMMRAE